MRSATNFHLATFAKGTEGTREQISLKLAVFPVLWKVCGGACVSGVAAGCVLRAAVVLLLMP